MIEHPDVIRSSRLLHGHGNSPAVRMHANIPERVRVSDDAEADKLRGLATVDGNPPQFRLVLTKGVLDQKRATVRRPENAQSVQLIQILRLQVARCLFSPSASHPTMGLPCSYQARYAESMPSAE